ncbi:unnamed protein product [Tilletia controversa]|uniref:Uncharacterized protein n=1 Tax=Tilletia controversa TaxID=13291 RepID=A0A8X7MSM9_9BASI|nr:hypothetical protein A4X06_0g5102 [Tilletia controversa]CAD6933794.1 unnamed protein product [Tilletia controversa]CAD6943266.1 unnamed protein product [Tilletia controversa]
MHFKLLLSLIALTSSAIAVTTGPYNVGSGHLTEVPSNIFAQQGQVNTVVNQTIGCDVAGPGLNLAGAPFQFQASSALPSRANDSSIYYFGRTEDRYQYWGVFSLGQSNFEISNNLTAFLRTKYPSTTQVSLKLSAFNVSISNATPSVKNLLPSGGYAASAKLGAGSFATFPSNAPSSTYPSPTFTPIASSIGKGQLAFLSYDNVAGSFELFDTNSASLGSVTFSCSEGAGK